MTCYKHESLFNKDNSISNDKMMSDICYGEFTKDNFNPKRFSHYPSPFTVIINTCPRLHKPFSIFLHLTIIITTVLTMTLKI